MLDELEAGGLCLNLNGRVHREEGLVFCGMNRVRDYPFGYKHWCVPDGEFSACPQQFCGEGLTLDERGEFIPLKNLAEHLATKPSIKQELSGSKISWPRVKCSEASGWFTSPRQIWAWTFAVTGSGSDHPRCFGLQADDQPLLGCSRHCTNLPIKTVGNGLDGSAGRSGCNPARLISNSIM